MAHGITSGNKKAGPDNKGNSRLVADGTEHRPLKFGAGDKASGAWFPDDLFFVVYHLAAADCRYRHPGDFRARIRRVPCAREHICIF